MKDRIPEFRNEKEEAKFWDTHDSTDFQSELKKDRLTKFVQRQNPAGAMKYCLGCSYCLEGLSEPRCPECGRGFDPNKPNTFAVKPPVARLRTPGNIFLLGSIIGTVLVIFADAGGEAPLCFMLGGFTSLAVLVLSLFSLASDRCRLAAAIAALSIALFVVKVILQVISELRS